MTEPKEPGESESTEVVDDALVPAPSQHPTAEPGFPVQPWAAPLLRLDQAWARLEVKLATGVLIGEIAALMAWVILKGLATSHQAGSSNKSGLVLRGVLAAVGLGVAAYVGLRGRVPERTRVMVTSGAVVVGIATAPMWSSAGASYFSNVLNWFQGSSTLTLVGGLNGVATRLTLWLALLGAAIATSQGKHINVDVVMRFLNAKLRVVVAVIGWVAASVVCSAGVWGFIDDIAIGHFLAPIDAPAGKKIAHVTHEMGKDFFLLRRQITLDLKTLPHVVKGESYSQYLGGKEWNDWMKGADWNARFNPEDVGQLMLPETEPKVTRLPIISIPGSVENVPGLLVRDFDMIVPFGLFVLAIRFLIRAILALTGHVKVDPDALHGDEDIEAAQKKLHASGEPKTEGA